MGQQIIPYRGMGEVDWVGIIHPAEPPTIEDDRAVRGACLPNRDRGQELSQSWRAVVQAAARRAPLERYRPGCPSARKIGDREADRSG